MQNSHEADVQFRGSWQWLFGLSTAMVLFGLGVFLETLDSSGTALIVLGTVIGGLNTYTWLRGAPPLSAQAQAIAIRIDD